MSLSTDRLLAVLVVAVLVQGAAPAQEGLDERLHRLESQVERQAQRIEEQAARIRQLEGRPPGADPDPAAIDRAVRRYLDRRPGGLALAAGFDGRFFVQDEDERFRLTTGGLLQIDAFHYETGNERNDSFDARRPRIDVEGHLYSHHRFKIQVEYWAGRADLLDAYYEAAYIEEAQLRVGQFKEPFSHDRLATWYWHDYIERSIGGTNLAPGRDVGAMIHGRVLDRHLSYSVGIFNGDGTNRLDGNDDKDLAARLEARPFRTSRSKWLKGLRLAASATVGRDENDGLGGRSLVDSSRHPFLTFAAGTTGGDDVVRAGADLVWLVGPASLTLEWMHIDQREVTRGGRKAAFEAHDAYIAMSYLLTGEDKTIPVLVPDRPFDPIDWKGYGAWELVARFDWFHLEDDQLLRGGFATGTDQVVAGTLGVNWYLNSHVRLQFNYVASYFDDPVGRAGDDLHSFQLRLQLQF